MTLRSSEAQTLTVFVVRSSRHTWCCQTVTLRATRWYRSYRRWFVKAILSMLIREEFDFWIHCLEHQAAKPSVTYCVIPKDRSTLTAVPVRSRIETQPRALVV